MSVPFCWTVLGDPNYFFVGVGSSAIGVSRLCLIGGFNSSIRFLVCQDCVYHFFLLCIIEFFRLEGQVEKIFAKKVH